MLSRTLHSFYPIISAAIISFSLTLMAVGIAIITNTFPLRPFSGMQRIDVGAVLLFVPLCALVFAIIAEAVRLTFAGSLDGLSIVPHRKPLSGPARRSLM